MNKIITEVECDDFQDTMDTLFSIGGYAMLVFVSVVIVGGAL